MKNKISIVTLASLIIISFCLFPSLLRAETDPCANVKKLDIDNVASLKNIFSNYTTYQPPLAYVNGNDQTEYLLCLKIIEDSIGVISEPLELTIKDDFNVHIVGLNLKSTSPIFLKVTNNKKGTVYIEKSTIQDIKTGLSLEGTGPIEIKDSKITGDASKSGSCIVANSPNAVFSNVTLSSCKEGIAVKANNIQIANSTISNVQTGLILEGAEKIEVSNTKITGDASKSGSCIVAGTPNAVFSNVTVSSCGEGITVKANGAQIADSKIFDNGLGIHVTNGFTGMSVS